MASDKVNPEDSNKLDLLRHEWEYLCRSVEWNFDVFERQRNYLFILITAMLGLTGSTPKIADAAWVFVGPLIIFFLFRLLNEFDFMIVKNRRRLQIEKRVSSLTGTLYFLRIGTEFKKDRRVGQNYAITIILLLLIILGALAFALYRAILQICQSSWFYPYMLFCIGILCLWIFQVVRMFISADYVGRGFTLIKHDAQVS